MGIHLTIWIGGPSARLTDTTNAGKRGKTCRVLSLNSPSLDGDAAHFIRFELPRLAGVDTAAAGGKADGGVFLPLLDFDVLAAKIREAAPPAVSTEDREIAGLEAPRERLTAGHAGKWSGEVDEGGVTLSDLTDRNNEPRAITSGQVKSRAYVLAAKVWPQVQAAATFGEAAKILAAAGCKLHHYCAVD